MNLRPGESSARGKTEIYLCWWFDSEGSLALRTFNLHHHVVYIWWHLGNKRNTDSLKCGIGAYYTTAVSVRINNCVHCRSLSHVTHSLCWGKNWQQKQTKPFMFCLEDVPFESHTFALQQHRDTFVAAMKWQYFSIQNQTPVRLKLMHCAYLFYRSF